MSAALVMTLIILIILIIKMVVTSD